MKRDIELEAMVDKGIFRDVAGLARAVAIHNGKRIRITIKEMKKRRSLSQNAYMWAVPIPLITEMMQGYGNNVSPEQVHDFLRAEVGKLWRTIIVGGKAIPVLRSTTELSTTEFEDYMEKIRAFASEEGVFIPLPNENIGEYNGLTQ